MAVNLHTDYNSANFLRSLKMESEMGFVAIIDDMIRVCKEFLVSTRGQLQDHSMHTYLDQTKQLRGSLAAYIFRNGLLIWSDGGKNDVVSRQIIREQIALTPSGFDIIGIASKEYASWVESKGYNVMTNQGEVFLFDMGKVFTKLGYSNIGALQLKSPTKAITKVSYGRI